MGRPLRAASHRPDLGEENFEEPKTIQFPETRGPSGEIKEAKGLKTTKMSVP